MHACVRAPSKNTNSVSKRATVPSFAHICHPPDARGTVAHTWSEPLKKQLLEKGLSWKKFKKTLRGAVSHSNQRERESLNDLWLCHLRTNNMSRKVEIFELFELLQNIQIKMNGGFSSLNTSIVCAACLQTHKLIHDYVSYPHYQNWIVSCCRILQWVPLLFSTVLHEQNQDNRLLVCVCHHVDAHLYGNGLNT